MYTIRMGKMLDKLMDHNQTTFIQGRRLEDAFLMAHEVLFSTKKTTMALACKLDFNKATTYHGTCGGLWKIIDWFTVENNHCEQTLKQTSDVQPMSTKSAPWFPCLERYHQIWRISGLENHHQCWWRQKHLIPEGWTGGSLWTDFTRFFYWLPINGRRFKSATTTWTTKLNGASA